MAQLRKLQEEIRGLGPDQDQERQVLEAQRRKLLEQVVKPMSEPPRDGGPEAADQRQGLVTQLRELHQKMETLAPDQDQARPGATDPDR